MWSTAIWLLSTHTHTLSHLKLECEWIWSAEHAQSMNECNECALVYKYDSTFSFFVVACWRCRLKVVELFATVLDAFGFFFSPSKYYSPVIVVAAFLPTSSLLPELNCHLFSPASKCVRRIRKKENFKKFQFECDLDGPSVGRGANDTLSIVIIISQETIWYLYIYECICMCRWHMYLNCFLHSESIILLLRYSYAVAAADVDASAVACKFLF